MIKTPTEMRRGIESQIKETNKLMETLEKLKAVSASNGGKHIKSITADQCALICWKEKLTITMETNELLGRNTDDIPITPATKIANAISEYTPKMP